MESLESGRFLLTEQEFSFIEHYFIKVKQDMEKLLGHSFTEEELLFSDLEINSDAVIDVLVHYSTLLINKSREI